jgi:hypothetical protein
MQSLETILVTAEKILAAATELTKLVTDFVKVIKELKEEPTPVVEAPKNAITLEDVRKVLTALSRDGHTAEVKALLTKHGVNRLSEVKAEEYETLLKEAEDIH